MLQLVEGKEGGIVFGSNEGEEVGVLLFPGERSKVGGERGVEPVV